MNVGIRDFKARLSEFIDRAQAGEEVVVTEHGRPVVRLVAVVRERYPEHLDRMIRRGELIPASRTVEAQLTKVANPAGFSLSEFLIRERENEPDLL
ncbi:MAG: type II toxin-antitoxin system Phd/YefM family antitoxin [Candidatus Dormibacteria bacterium]